MINALLNILDRLIQLLTLRDRRGARLFTELWEPTFNELLQVHRDYIELFEETGLRLSELDDRMIINTHIQDGSEELEFIIDMLRKRKREFEPVRRKLIALIETLDKVEFDELSAAFVQALAWYFPVGMPRSRSTAASEMQTRMEALAAAINDQSVDKMLDQMTVRDMVNYVRQVINAHRTAWSRVCEAYAPLRLRYAQRTTS